MHTPCQHMLMHTSTHLLLLRQRLHVLLHAPQQHGRQCRLQGACASTTHRKWVSSIQSWYNQLGQAGASTLHMPKGCCTRCLVLASRTVPRLAVLASASRVPVPRMPCFQSSNKRLYLPCTCPWAVHSPTQQHSLHTRGRTCSSWICCTEGCGPLAEPPKRSKKSSWLGYSSGSSSARMEYSSAMLFWTGVPAGVGVGVGVGAGVGVGGKRAVRWWVCYHRRRRWQQKQASHPAPGRLSGSQASDRASLARTQQLPPTPRSPRVACRASAGLHPSYL